MISSKDQLEKAALDYGLLPFFSNRIPGFSVEEMAAPGMLFGEESDDYGCWEWKGPVIREQTTAYGKFFRRKAGFVSLSLLPDFLNYRRHAYPVSPGSTEAMILDIIREHEGLTSTELKRIVFDSMPREKNISRNELPETTAGGRPKRKTLESPLQRLQMGGWILIADFEYKYTSRGDRYGWGVALYSTPEIWLGNSIATTERTPQESLEHLVDHPSEKLPGTDRRLILNLLA